MKKLLLPLTAICLFYQLPVYAFDNSNFKGGYAFRLVGPSSIVSANQRTVGTGMLLADGNGHVTGRGSFRSGGVTCATNIAGTYHVNADGTGVLASTLTTTTSGCFTSVLDLAIVLANKGKTFEVANNENDYMDGTLTRQDIKNFKLKDFKGAYALRLEGPSSLVQPNLPLTVGVALLTADGNGHVTGNGSLRSAGATCLGSFTGTYQVNADGTGIIATNFTPTTSGCFQSVVDLSMALFTKGNGAEAANIENDYMAGSLNRQVLK